MRMHHFGAQNGPFAPNKFFLGKLLVAFSSNYRPVSLCKIKKKNPSSRSRVMKMQNFWAQNDPLPQVRIFPENLLMCLVSFIHAYLHAKNQSQVLLLVK